MGILKGMCERRVSSTLMASHRSLNLGVVSTICRDQVCQGDVYWGAMEVCLEEDRTRVASGGRRKRGTIIFLGGVI